MTDSRIEETVGLLSTDRTGTTAIAERFDAAYLLGLPPMR